MNTSRTAKTYPSHAQNGEADPISFRLRLAGVATLIVGATLATAVGSTALTGLILGEETSVVTVAPAPATQPAAIIPATQPAAVAAVVPPLTDVLPIIANRSLHTFNVGESNLASLGLDGRLLGDPLAAATATDSNVVSIAVGGSSTPTESPRDAIRAAFDQTFTGAPAARPVTFGGSPDLADAYRSFRSGAADDVSYELPEGTAVADAVPALGMDAPTDGKTTDDKTDVRHTAKPVAEPVIRKTPRVSRSSDAASGLTWETGVNSRPNGQSGNTRSPIYIDPTVDPFDGGGRGSMYGEIPGTGVVPEPASLLTLLAVAGGTLVRRRHR